MDEQMKTKILEALKIIMAAMITAMNESVPFMFSGVIGNGANPTPFGLTCGNGVQLEELKPFFEMNNVNMFAAQSQGVETINKATEPKGIEVEIVKNNNGGVDIKFNNQPNLSVG